MIDDDERIRQEAHKLWEQEGRPEGRSDRHWAEAREIVALRDSNQTTLKPVEDTIEEPVEPALAAENLGDLPGLTDRGDEVLSPNLDAAREISDEPPLVTDKDAKKQTGAGKGKVAAAPSSKDKPKPAAGKSKSSAKSKSEPKADDKTSTKRKPKGAGS